MLSLSTAALARTELEPALLTVCSPGLSPERIPDQCHKAIS
jgi:hypothetical protein